MYKTNPKNFESQSTEKYAHKYTFHRTRTTFNENMSILNSKLSPHILFLFLCLYFSFLGSAGWMCAGCWLLVSAVIAVFNIFVVVFRKLLSVCLFLAHPLFVSVSLSLLLSPSVCIHLYITPSPPSPCIFCTNTNTHAHTAKSLNQFSMYAMLFRVCALVYAKNFLLLRFNTKVLARARRLMPQSQPHIYTEQSYGAFVLYRDHIP